MGETRKVKYLLVGGGVASVKASMGIRELDKDGSILIVKAENRLPYDRPPLSKGILLGKATPEDAESKFPNYYPDNRIDLELGTRVESIGLEAKRVSLSNGQVVEYERLLLATGSRPRNPDLKGTNLSGVHLLREVEDSLAIRSSMDRARRAVFVGAGYIGMEVAAACLAQGIEVSIVEPMDHPWAKFASPLTGNYLRSAFERQGTTFFFKDQVESLAGENAVERAILRSGQELEADMVVIGVGVEANLELPRDAGLSMDERHGVLVDETLRTSDPNVWAAGDISAFPDPHAGKVVHYEHHLNADWQGKQAGRNMAGASEPYDRVAYFFSDMGDIHMALRGVPQAGTSVKHIGDVDSGEYVELFAREDGSICMGIAFSHSEPRLDPISDKLEEAISNRILAGTIDETHFGYDSDKGLG